MWIGFKVSVMKFNIDFLVFIYIDITVIEFSSIHMFSFMLS